MSLQQCIVSVASTPDASFGGSLADEGIAIRSAGGTFGARWPIGFPALLAYCDLHPT